jgi:hypothetical protein
MADLSHTQPTAKPAYQIVYGSEMGTIERLVMELMEDGWRPVGGICVVEAKGFYQSMFKGGES